MQFYFDSPATLPVTWYFVPDDRPCLPFATVFSSRIYDRKEEPQLPIGELYSPVPWRGGQAPGPVAACGKCGDAIKLIKGVSIDDPAPETWPGTNVAKCCCPPPPQFLGEGGCGGIWSEPFRGEAAGGGLVLEPFRGEGGGGGTFASMVAFTGEAAGGGLVLEPFTGEAAGGGTFEAASGFEGGGGGGGGFEAASGFEGGGGGGGEFSAESAGGCLAGNTPPDVIGGTLHIEEGLCGLDSFDFILNLSSDGFPITGQTTLYVSDPQSVDGVMCIWQLNCDTDSSEAQLHLFSEDGMTLYASSTLGLILWDFGFEFPGEITIGNPVCPDSSTFAFDLGPA